MWLSAFAPLVNPSRFSRISCNGKCSLRRSSTQPFAKKPRTYSRWTTEETRKVEDLVKQGLKLSAIVNEMNGRTYTSIVTQVGKARMGLGFRDETGARRIQRWSAEEDALMAEKLEQGLTPLQIMSFFPGRTYGSVTIHAQRLRSWYTGQRERLRNPAGSLVLRIIDMKVKEAKNFQEIAHELGVKYEKVHQLWASQCIKMVTKEMLDQIYLQHNWSPAEIEHLVELHRRATLCIRDAALQFPSKTLPAVRAKACRLQLSFPRRSKKPEVSVAIKSEENPEQ